MISVIAPFVIRNISGKVTMFSLVITSKSFLIFSKAVAFMLMLLFISLKWEVDGKLQLER